MMMLTSLGRRSGAAASSAYSAAFASRKAVAVPSSSRFASTLVLLRHGQSEWNLANLFTGWHDVNLTDQGRAEAREAGKLLKEEGLEFDATFTSLLKRAISTQNIALEEMDRQWYPVTRTWRLNERHYGALQGLNKTETVQKYGEEQVLEWRRSYAIPPPSVEEASDHYPGNDIRYADIPKDEIPLAESLATTGVRLMPEWEGNIQPLLKDGKTVLITAHGNSLRALVKILDGISEEEILGVNIPTGVPLLYQLDDDLNPVPQEGAASPLSGRYLGNPEEIAARAQAVANQTSA